MSQQLHRAVGNQEQDIDNGKLAGYCILCQVPYPCEYIGLPTAADQSRVIEALNIYQSSFQSSFSHPCQFEQDLPQLCRTHNYDPCPVETIKQVLAEAARIMEGK